MRPILLSCLFFLFFLPYLFGQYVIHGEVIDAETNHVIAGANVYINNSLIRSISTKDGTFSLKLPANNSYELVASSMGYEILTTQISSYSTKIVLKLKKKTLEIEEVTVRPFLKDGWAVWGKFFMDSFIGNSKFAKNTKILNRESLRFRYDEEKKLLTVVASEPLKIINKDLGYSIAYDLHQFQMNFRSQYLYFEGYSFFEEAAKVSKSNLKNRGEAYSLSIMRFVQSTYHQSWEKDGYTVRHMIRKKNEERNRVDSIMKLVGREVFLNGKGGWEQYYLSQNKYNKDSIDYFRRILQQPMIFSILGQKVDYNDIMTTTDQDDTKEIFYQDYLYVTLNQAKLDPNYFSLFPKKSGATVLSLLSQSPLFIYESGSYAPPVNWVLEGYWAWYDKLSTMLPLGYSED